MSESIKERERQLEEEISFKTEYFVLLQARCTKQRFRTRIATNCDELTSGERKIIIDDLRNLANQLENIK